MIKQLPAKTETYKARAYKIYVTTMNFKYQYVSGTFGILQNANFTKRIDTQTKYKN